MQQNWMDVPLLSAIGALGSLMLSVWSYQVAQGSKKRGEEQAQAAKDLENKMALEAYKTKEEVRKEFASIPWIKEIEYQLNHRVIRSIETSMMALKAALDKTADQASTKHIVELLEEIKIDIDDMKRQETKNFMDRFDGKK